MILREERRIPRGFSSASRGWMTRHLTRARYTHRIRRDFKAADRGKTICRDPGDRRDLPARVTGTKQVNAPRVPLSPRFHV